MDKNKWSYHVLKQDILNECKNRKNYFYHCSSNERRTVKDSFFANQRIICEFACTRSARVDYINTSPFSQGDIRRVSLLEIL